MTGCSLLLFSNHKLYSCPRWTKSAKPADSARSAQLHFMWAHPRTGFSWASLELGLPAVLDCWPFRIGDDLCVGRCCVGSWSKCAGAEHRARKTFPTYKSNHMSFDHVKPFTFFLWQLEWNSKLRFAKRVGLKCSHICIIHTHIYRYIYVNVWGDS